MDAGFTLALHAPLPEPLAVVIPSLKVKVHTPFAVTIPLMLVPLPPPHIDAAPLVMLAVGELFTVTVSDPPSAPEEHPEASLRELMV